jgi:allantoinase
VECGVRRRKNTSKRRMPAPSPRLLMIPYTPDANDFHYFANRFATSEDFFVYLRDTFDVLYGESREKPKMMSVGIHVRISGRPGRSKALERFLEYVLRTRKKAADVWIARRDEIARWWIDHYEGW